MARKGPQIEKTCVICGKLFKVYPSDTKQCCSKKCGAALRTKNGNRGGTHWNPDAKNAFRENPAAVKAREESSPKGLAAAAAMPEGQKGPQNREALVWILIDPNGNYHKAVNLLDWARNNRELFFPPDVPEDAAAHRIASGFRAIASSMRGAKSRERPVQSYKGWRLAELPRPKKDGLNGNTVNVSPTERTGRPLKDLTGQTFGNFVVLGPAGKNQGYGSSRYLWRVRCKLCGRVKVYDGVHIRLATETTSCGCRKNAPYQKICAICGTPFIGGRRKIYCEECAKRIKVEKARDYRAKKRREKNEKSY